MNIMVTGGAGYIGSHTCVELMKAGHSAVIFDDFSRSHPNVVDRIRRLTGVVPIVIAGDIRDRKLLEETLSTHRCDAVIHLAGLKSVPESIENPYLYQDINVGGTRALLQAIETARVHRVVFASTAAVYGTPASLPVREDHALQPSNPYGGSKLAVETLLETIASDRFRVAILRFFNPVGAHESGLIGEDPRGNPGNLMPQISQVAIGRRPWLDIFGDDYPTSDGTTVRDYLHVMDLVAAQIRAMEALERERLIKVNLGTGHGYSVLQLVDAFSRTCGRNIPCRFAPRRAGDIAESYASGDLAQKMLGWRAERSLDDMCRDVWRWQSLNPQGFESAPSSRQPG
ncbi:UDP-glucose 4-epimerase GalE [Bradyrhizobium sp.]|uniref:UDP-glucose 4-epimerase GalE n=1 Tax=Bradyrhizobium sp. TaxID=376 RepID=UPI001E1A0CC3|nr:UDP-glucose 4-epimerase GalE [Bradyrhizobium sp.]MBI5321081.1 UDP-glucose 4-epimerase GalE [Bradyrhizobium sp.]